MSEDSSSRLDAIQVYRRMAGLVALLGFLSIGGANIISAVVKRSFGLLEPVSLALIPVYFVAAFFIRRGSKIAYLVAFAAFVLSSIYTLVASFVNADQVSEVVGNPGFAGVSFFNLLFMVIVLLAFIQGLRAIFRSPPS